MRRTAKFLSFGFEQRSLFTIKDQQQVQPLIYRYEENVPGRNNNGRLIFDWDNMRMKNEQAGTFYEISPGVLDGMNYIVQMSLDASQSPGYTLTYPVMDGDRLWYYEFVAEKEETINTAMGKMRTLRYRYEQGVGDKKRSTQIWLAPDLDYLPVQLDHRDSKNQRRSLKLRKLTWGSEGGS